LARVVGAGFGDTVAVVSPISSSSDSDISMIVVPDDVSGISLMASVSTTVCSIDVDGIFPLVSLSGLLPLTGVKGTSGDVE
jgi:hypothetical protein